MTMSEATKSTKRSTEADLEVGRRIRIRRMEQGLSQTELGTRVGVTFQQVQKYERGINRVGAGRLQQIAQVLGCNVEYFFATGDQQTTETRSLPTEFVTQPDAFKLLSTFNTISNAGLRRSIVRLVEQIAGRP